jgi:hypothetical protein
MTRNTAGTLIGLLIIVDSLAVAWYRYAADHATLWGTVSYLSLSLAIGSVIGFLIFKLWAPHLDP